MHINKYGTEPTITRFSGMFEEAKTRYGKSEWVVELHYTWLHYDDLTTYGHGETPEAAYTDAVEIMHGDSNRDLQAELDLYREFSRNIDQLLVDIADLSERAPKSSLSSQKFGVPIRRFMKDIDHAMTLESQGFIVLYRGPRAKLTERGKARVEAIRKLRQEDSPNV